VTSLLDLYVKQIIKYVPDSDEYDKHLAQHKKIYKAIKAKDLNRAKKALNRHLHSTAEDVEKMHKAVHRK